MRGIQRGRGTGFTPISIPDLVSFTVVVSIAVASNWYCKSSVSVNRCP
jgi:hypothetical protein